MKCQADHCEACDDVNPSRCDVCEEGFGITPEGTCDACAADCKTCSRLAGHSCAECKDGFALDGSSCLACADQCLRCDIEGPGRCNKDQCSPGWVTKRMSKGLVCV